jgi:hypothetical protein
MQLRQGHGFLLIRAKNRFWGIGRSFNDYFNVFQLQYFHRMYSRLEKKIRRKKERTKMGGFSRRKIIWPCRCFERGPSSRRRRSPTRTGRAIIEDGTPSSTPQGLHPVLGPKGRTSFIIPLMDKLQFPFPKLLTEVKMGRYALAASASYPS